LVVTDLVHNNLSGSEKQILAAYGFKLSLFSPEEIPKHVGGMYWNSSFHENILKGYYFSLRPSEEVEIPFTPTTGVNQKTFITFNLVGTNAELFLNCSSSQVTKVFIGETQWNISSSKSGNSTNILNFVETVDDNVYGGLDCRAGVHFVLECTNTSVKLYLFGPSAQNCTSSVKLVYPAVKPLEDILSVKFSAAGTTPVYFSNLQHTQNIPNCL